MKKHLTVAVILCFALLGLTACEERTMEEEQTEYQTEFQESVLQNNSGEDDEAQKRQLEQLIVGEDYFLVLYDDGTVWSWGNNAEGKLGTIKRFVSEPQKIEGLEGVIKLEDGGSNVFALTEQGDVYTWGQKEGVVHTIPKDYSALLYKPMKMEDFKEVVDITARNKRLYALNAEGKLYVSDIPWGRMNFYSFSPVQDLGQFGEIEHMFMGAGCYDYFIRTDGTVFSLMSFMYEDYKSNAYAFIFPHMGDVILAGEELPIYMNNSPEGLPEINVLDLSGKGDYLIYYDLTGVDGINVAGSDPYTVFLGKEDGTLHYWNSDRIKYHDNEFALTQPETRRERCDGNFEEISIADILGLDSDVSEIPRVVSIQPAMENTLFLTDDGRVFASGYETYETSDVTYGLWSVPNPGRDSHVITRKIDLKELVFQKLKLTDIASIWTNGKNCFCAVDSAGRYYRFTINDNEVTQIDQGMLPYYAKKEKEEPAAVDIFGEDLLYSATVDPLSGEVLYTGYRGGYWEQDIEYNGETKDGLGNVIETYISLPRIDDAVYAADVINRKIEEDAAQFYEEQLAFHEAVREEETALGRWENLSRGSFICRLAYADEHYVSIVYRKDFSTYEGGYKKEYMTRLYSSDTGEELQPEDLFAVSWDEVSLRLYYLLRETDRACDLFSEDLLLPTADSERIFYCLTGEGFDVFYVEDMRTFKEDHFVISYKELEGIYLAGDEGGLNLGFGESDPQDYGDENAEPFVDEELYLYIKGVYEEIDWDIQFLPGDESKYDLYRGKFIKLLEEEIPVVDEERGYETTLSHLGEIKWDINYSEYDPNHYNYYFYDVDGDGTPELGLTNNQRFVYIFKYEEEADRVVLWDEYIGGRALMGTGKFKWLGGWAGSGLMRLDQNGDYVFLAKFKVIGSSKYIRDDDEGWGYFVALPEYVEAEDWMMAQMTCFDTDEYYFRVTKEQYAELNRRYVDAGYESVREMKEVTYTYAELVNLK